MCYRPEIMSCKQLKFHWDQFPRNFPVANVTEKSPTSYEEVGRVASLLRGNYEEAGDFQTISTCQDGLATSPTSPRGSYEELVPVEFELTQAALAVGLL